MSRADTEALIALLDKHTDKAIGYLRMNREEAGLLSGDMDKDDRTIIWNQMSELLSDYVVAGAPRRKEGP